MRGRRRAERTRGAPHAAPGQASSAGSRSAPAGKQGELPASRVKLHARLLNPVLLAAAVAVAAGIALRMWRIGSGLPDFLDEAIPWKTALKMWVDERRVDWNPHFFNYPSLTIYLCLFLQKLAFAIGQALGRYTTAADFLMDYEMDPSSLVIAARTMGVAFDVLTIVLVARIGERLMRWAGVVAAAVVALAPTMIATSRAIYTDTYMAAFALWALERMLAFRAGGRPSQLVAAAVLTGLAAGSKYPAALLVIPLAWVLIERRGFRGLMVWVLACVAALGVFLITSPYVVLDFGRFLKDFGFERFHMSQGHLGSAGRRGFLFQLQTLAGDIGWIGVALLVVSLAATLAAPRRWGDRLALWLFLLPVGLAISLARVEAGRYLVPVIPVAAMLAAVVALDLARRFGARRPALAVAVVAAALIVPVAPRGLATAASGSDHTQALARRWCEANVPEPALLLHEGYTAGLHTRQRVTAVQRTRGFRLASAARQRRFLARRVFDAVDLPLIAAGHASTLLSFGGGRTQRLQVFEQPADINQIFYDLRLLHGVDYVLTSGAIRGRFEADTARFPVQRRFYRFLDRAAERVASFRSGGGVSGPTVDIYRLGDRAREGIVRAGALHALWWAEYVPQGFRREFEEITVDPLRRSGGALLQEGGVIAPWVFGLEAFFDADVRPFARLLAWELVRLDRFAAAEPLTEAVHFMHTSDVAACLAFVRCAGALQHWVKVEDGAARTIPRADEQDPSLPELRYVRALALTDLGRKSEALRELEWVLARAPRDGELWAAAEALVRRLGPLQR